MSFSSDGSFEEMIVKEIVERFYKLRDAGRVAKKDLLHQATQDVLDLRDIPFEQIGTYMSRVSRFWKERKRKKPEAVKPSTSPSFKPVARKMQRPTAEEIAEAERIQSRMQRGRDAALLPSRVRRDHLLPEDDL